jgi:hypothetical protein
MATSGVKKIKISTIDREGYDNSSKFLDLEELIINHPKVIDDINNIGVSGSNILGGPTSYPITNTRQNVNNFLFTIVPTSQNSNLTQTITPDIAVYATSSNVSTTNISNIITVLSNRQSQTNTLFTTSEVQWIGGWKTLYFPTASSSNVAGWLKNFTFPISQLNFSYFQIEDIPTTQYRIRVYGKIHRNGSISPSTQSLYCMISDYIPQDYLTTNYATSASFRPIINSSFPLGYQLQSTLISASNGQDQNIDFDFIVTQSYSRILNKPIGPTYGPTKYTLGESSTLTPPTWYVSLAAGTGSSSNSELYISRSGLFLEITPYPTTSLAPTIDIINSSSVSYNDIKLYGGNIFPFAGVSWSVIVPEFTTGIAEASLTVGNIDTWVKAGYISAYSITNFPSNSFYNTNSTYKGFRVASLLTTSSYIPLVDTDENYATSEFNPLINNVDLSPQSVFYYDLDYSNGMSTPVNLPQVNQGSAEKARINDSNYSRESWNNIRYRGSRVTSPGINKT